MRATATLTAASAATSADLIGEVIAVAELAIAAPAGREDRQQLAHVRAVAALTDDLARAHLSIGRKYLELGTAIRAVKLVKGHRSILLAPVLASLHIIAHRAVVMPVLAPLTNPEENAIIMKRPNENKAQSTWTTEK
jgi:hypothetical protein